MSTDPRDDGFDTSYRARAERQSARNCRDVHRFIAETLGEPYPPLPLPPMTHAELMRYSADRLERFAKIRHAQIAAGQP